ncbi:hypothetical protein [Longispora sp. NPDC051575]|uniref:hypothetical protein n=1 Tax=Longispora sp. NPDC051575 TaxID=3154943 RepID=UPI00342C93B7
MTKNSEVAAEPTQEHHPQPPPDEHLCTCGKLREECLRDQLHDMFQIPPTK